MQSMNGMRVNFFLAHGVFERTKRVPCRGEKKIDSRSTVLNEAVRGYRAAGFTLLEMLLSIALVSLITGVSLPVYQSFQTRNYLDIATVTTAHSLRRAQLLSQASDGDISWGVAVQAGSVSLFKGISYAARDASFDEIFEMPGSISPSGIPEIVFAKFTGFPQTIGTITLTSNTNETRSITINQKGMVSY